LEETLFLLKITDLENCALLGYYTTSIGASLPTFRDNLSVPSSRVKKLFLTFEDVTEMFVPKCRQGSTNTRCAITQKSAVLIRFAAKALNQA